MKKLLLIGAAILMFLVSCGGNSDVNIINPDADFLYFYGATCPHCQDLNKKLKEVDLYSKVSIEKREVWYNKVNQAVFYETAASLGLKEADLSVPFVYNKATGEYVVGTDLAFEMLKSGTIQTSIDSSTGTTIETSTGTVQ